ncbi:MAG: hypothetical protein KBT36_09120 [Kurthia sp.]|nr:hypothetical protein [Candidatus Kurthia equi]
MFIVIAKKRKDRNEPIWGWKRKQYLQEMRGETTNSPATVDNGSEQENQQRQKEEESIMDLLELKNIEHGVVERERNEHYVVLSSDFVNFSLLQPSERVSILEGYQQLFNMINFPIQLLGQAVRQDFAKERFRFEQNLKKCNAAARAYNMDVVEHIEKVTEKDFRITLRIYYVIKYIYEPSKLAKLSKEQREQHILDNVVGRAEIVRRALSRAKVRAKILGTIESAEVLKRALNRDRMVLHPIETIIDDGKLAPYVTMDLSTLPDFKKFVQDIEEAIEIAKVS